MLLPDLHFFAQVEGQRLVYNFYKLPYKYEPGITRTVYRERFQRINTTLRQEEPLANKSILHEPVSACSASTISATSPTSTPLRKSWSWPVVPMPSPQVCWCPNAVPCLYSPCCSRSRIFYPILSPFRARGVGPTELAFTKKPLVSGVARPSSSLTAVWLNPDEFQKSRLNSVPTYSARNKSWVWKNIAFNYLLQHNKYYHNSLWIL